MKAKYIFIVYPGSANYPEIEAYKKYFSNRYEVKSGTLEDYTNFKYKSDTILWCLMGLYYKKLECKYLIHDYRSLSVGNLSKAKDLIKFTFNVKPNLRIFLNNEVKDVYQFSDKTPSIYLDMGLPDSIFSAKFNYKYKSTYCYIGEMSRLRKFERFLDDFIFNRDEYDTMTLVGDVDSNILDKYRSYEYLNFAGKLKQSEVFDVVKSCEFSICYLPNEYPYYYQTPTKLLEYIALGSNVICNNVRSNIALLNRLSVKACVKKGSLFSGCISNTELPENLTMDNFLWNNVIQESGIEKYI